MHTSCLISHPFCHRPPPPSSPPPTPGIPPIQDTSSSRMIYYDLDDSVTAAMLMAGDTAWQVVSAAIEENRRGFPDTALVEVNAAWNHSLHPNPIQRKACTLAGPVAAGRALRQRRVAVRREQRPLVRGSRPGGRPRALRRGVDISTPVIERHLQRCYCCWFDRSTPTTRSRSSTGTPSAARGATSTRSSRRTSRARLSPSAWSSCSRPRAAPSCATS